MLHFAWYWERAGFIKTDTSCNQANLSKSSLPTLRIKCSEPVVVPLYAKILLWWDYYEPVLPKRPFQQLQRDKLKWNPQKTCKTKFTWIAGLLEIPNSLFNTLDCIVPDTIIKIETRIALDWYETVVNVSGVFGKLRYHYHTVFYVPYQRPKTFYYNHKSFH